MIHHVKTIFFLLTFVLLLSCSSEIDQSSTGKLDSQSEQLRANSVNEQLTTVPNNKTKIGTTGPTDSKALQPSSTLYSSTPTPTMKRSHEPENTIQIQLPFTIEHEPVGIMPMGETINHSPPKGHPGIDFQWLNGDAEIIVAADGIVGDFFTEISPYDGSTVYQIVVVSEGYGITYEVVDLHKFRPNLKIGDELTYGMVLGHPQVVEFGDGTMIHWGFGLAQPTGGRANPEGVVTNYFFEWLCPLPYFTTPELIRLNNLWETAYYNDKKQFPHLCNEYYKLSEKEEERLGPLSAVLNQQKPSTTSVVSPTEIPTRSPAEENTYTPESFTPSPTVTPTFTPVSPVSTPKPPTVTPTPIPTVPATLQPDALQIFVTWSNWETGEWSPSSTPPECGPLEEMFDVFPLDLALIDEYTPPGRSGGNDLYISHGHLRSHNTPHDQISVKFPAKGFRLYAVSRRQENYSVNGKVSTDEEQVKLEFHHPCGIKIMIDHIAQITDRWSEIIENLPVLLNDSRVTFMPEGQYFVESGEALGRAIGHSTNTYLDFGVYDLRNKNDLSEIMERDFPQYAATANHAICWADLFGIETQKLLEGKSVGSSDFCKLPTSTIEE